MQLERLSLRTFYLDLCVHCIQVLLEGGFVKHQNLLPKFDFNSLFLEHVNVGFLRLVRSAHGLCSRDACNFLSLTTTCIRTIENPSIESRNIFLEGSSIVSS